MMKYANIAALPIFGLLAIASLLAFVGWMIASHSQPLAFERSRDTPIPFTRPIAAELVTPPAEYAPPVQAVDTLPLTRVVADDVREQGYEIQQLRVFVVVLAVFLLPLWIVAPFGLFRRNVAQPVPVVLLAPHEVELLIRRIEDEIGSQASAPSVVRMVIELGRTPPQPSWRSGDRGQRRSGRQQARSELKVANCQHLVRCRSLPSILRSL
jgi:hypothetical protein